MAERKKKQPETSRRVVKGGHIEGAGQVIRQPIVETLKENYMPYAMSVIVSRAIPEIDGFKPAHRKLLYTMYKMGLLTGGRIKSANVVGQTMRLNPHGDAAIYETMVRLARGNESLLVPYVDSKGNFGKSYSRDMAYAASRYTEVKLEKVCSQIFADIDKDTVDFVDNYDSTTKEPTLLPVTFPTILANTNTGIAVGMASNICSFNLVELCETTAALIRNPDHPIPDTLLAPDFPGGGFLLYDREELNKIYETGRGSVRVRSRYTYDPSGNCIDITEIPPTTTVEAIMDKVVELVKAGKIREISDMRDETDLNGLKLTLDLKRGTDADKLMQKLFKVTPLEDTFSCNFNVLVAGSPKVMGAREILTEWTAFRRECIRRGIFFDLGKKKDRLHLLLGLKKILLDIDKAIKIIRETKEEAEVVPNLMIGFGIDQIQAEFVAEIKLRHLNEEFILKRLADIEDIKKEITDMEEILKNPEKVDAIIVSQLKSIAKEYGTSRKTQILYELDSSESVETEEIPDYPVNLFFTKEGYFKKITPLSLRMGGEQKLKEGDMIISALESTNTAELLFVTNQGNVYKSRAADFDDTKASVLGDYVASKLGMDNGEYPLFMGVTTDYKGYMVFFFENGKVAKVDLSAYETKQRRKKLVNAVNIKSPLVWAEAIREDKEYVMRSSVSRILIVHTALLNAKDSKSTQGVAVMTLSKKGSKVIEVLPYESNRLENDYKFRSKNLPAAGGILKDFDRGEQLTL